MAPKLSISGTFSSGKTTVVNSIRASVPNAIILAEHAWNIKSLFPQIDWTSQIVRDYMLFSQLVREKEIVALNVPIICDTGVLESIAHSLVFGLNPRVELLEELFHDPYDLLFICDYKEVFLVDNNVRETNPELREKLHDAILRVARNLGYNPIFLTGDADERTHSVLDALDKFRSSQ